MKYMIDVKKEKRRTVSIAVRPDGNVEVRAPLFLSQGEIDAFLDEKEDWIVRSVEAARRKARQLSAVDVLSEAEIRAVTEKARRIITARVRYFSDIMKVSYSRISIRHQKSRWGSCSAAGNLNFNAALVLAPPEVLDYVVVHELAHRKEMNHSPAFWAEVEAVLPDYRDRWKWLKEQGPLLLRQMGIS